jgi:peptidoglycan/xylan/chitin deacetylase (PgdA/CDA1 family)
MRRVALIVMALGLAACGSSAHPPVATHGASKAHVTTTRRVHTTVTGTATGNPGTTPVPILMYHVINPPPPGAPFPGLYVPASEFAAQMQALKAAGWHAVTLDQLRAYWTRGVPLPPGKPIVQYSNALPVLKQMGWVGNEMMQLSGLPPSQGGLSDAQVHALVSDGWELDTQGMSHADLIALPSSELHYQVFTARHLLRRRYGVTADWFAYPSGHYDANVIATLKAAGFVGSMTVVPGWASPGEDPFRLPRLRVLGGTSPSALLAQIATAQAAGAPPAVYP